MRKQIVCGTVMLVVATGIIFTVVSLSNIARERRRQKAQEANAEMIQALEFLGSLEHAEAYRTGVVIRDDGGEWYFRVRLHKGLSGVYADGEGITVHRNGKNHFFEPGDVVGFVILYHVKPGGEPFIPMQRGIRSPVPFLTRVLECEQAPETTDQGY